MAASGGWSITTAKPLAIGAHSLSASEVDVAANKSPATPAQSLSFLAAAPNRAVFVGGVGADSFTGGAGNDIFKFSAANLAATDTVKGGLGSDELVMTTAGTVRAGLVNGVESYLLANGGKNSLTLANANFAGGVTGASITVVGGNAGNTVNASGLTGVNRVVAVGGAGADNFTGGAGNDIFKFSAANLAAADTVKGGLGSDQLVMTTAGTVRAGLVNGVESYLLANGGKNSLTLVNANFAGGVTGASITVFGGAAGNTVNAAGLTGANRVVAVGGAGADNFTGGAGNDIFKFTAATLSASDAVAGGGGTDQLALTTAGAVQAGLVKGVEVYRLASGGANSLTLASANFAGGVTGASITVIGGSGANTLGEAGVAAADRAALRGGAGADTLIAGRNALLTGNGGQDRFELTTPGSAAVPDKNTIADFAHGVDRLGLSEAGFGLGAAPSAATLFQANATGAFTTAAQRFAYDTASGALSYDADGSGHASAPELIASLTGPPALTAGDSFLCRLLGLMGVSGGRVPKSWRGWIVLDGRRDNALAAADGRRGRHYA